MSKEPADPSMKIEEPKSPQNLGIIVGSILAVTFIGAGAIVTVILLRPKEDNAVLITAILGFLGPTTAALLAVLKSMQTGQAVQELHMAVNSRLTQLLEITAKSSLAEGRAAAATAAATKAAELAVETAVVTAKVAEKTAAALAAAPHVPDEADDADDTKVVDSDDVGHVANAAIATVNAATETVDAATETLDVAVKKVAAAREDALKKKK